MCAQSAPTLGRAAQQTEAPGLPVISQISAQYQLGIFLFSFFFFFVFLGLCLQHMEVPTLGVEWELQLPTYTTAHGNARFLTH